MKTRLFSILCILMMSIGIQAHDLEPLHVDGRYMKNSKGDIVTLHGYISNWGNLYFDIPEVRDGAEKDLLLFKITTDSILNSGWKVDYARLHFLNHLNSYASPSDFDGFVRNNLFETYYLPRIEYLNSKGIYVLLMADIADIADEYDDIRYLGDLRYQGLLKYWNYVSSHPRIKNNPGVMFELANEPGAFQGSDGSLNDFRTLKAYFQPMVDIIRNNGCEQIIWVPGSGCQWEYRGYASYPIEGDNIGYAVHAYDWCGGRDYENIRKFWDVTVKAASNMAPIIVSETGWEGRYALNLIGDGTKPEDPPLTSDFGINIKRVMDELGNVSFNLLNPSEELINTGLPTETPSVINDTEGPLVPGKEWYKEYAKTKYTPPTSLSATKIELIEAPTTVLPSKVIPLTLMATFNDGRKWNVAGDAVWTSSDESVLVVNHGNIFVKSEGTATVRGQYTDGTGKDFNTQFTIESKLFPLTQQGVENFWEATFDEVTYTFSGAGDIGWAYTEKNPVDGISQCKSIDLQDYQYIVVRMNEPKSEGVYGGFKIYTHEAGYIGEDEEKGAFVDLPPGKSEVIIDLHQLPNIDLTHIEKVVFWVYNSSLNVKEVFLSNDGVNPLRYVQSTTIKASDTTMNYGDEVPQLPYTISGFANVGMPKLTTTATKTSPVGTYDITAEAGSGADDGIRYLKGRMTVMKTPLMVGVEDVTINEGDAIPTIFTLTYDGWRNNDNSNALTSKPIASTTAASSSLPGTYPITISGGEATNYHLIYGQGTLTILEDENPASYRTYTLTPDIFHEWDGCTATSKIVNNDYQGEIHVGEKLAAAELIYGDMAVYYTHYADVTKYNQLLIEGTPGMELRVLLNRLEVGNGGGDENGGSWTELNPVIGDDGKAIVDLPNLEFVHLNAIKMGWESPEGVIKSLYLARGQVEQPVTITANNLTMVYGDDMPTLTYSSEGGELKGTPKLSTTATKNSPVGTYPIKVEKGTLTNEKVTYVEGTLTITQAPLTVSVQDVTITEGDAIPSFALTYSGFRNDDTEANAFTTKPTATTTATVSSMPGTYPISVSGGESKNYALNYQSGTLTILEDENPASYRTYTLTPDIFHEWDGCTATSKIVNNDYQGEIHVGEKLAAAELIYGDMAVYYTHYADVTKYNQLLIEGTPGMELRVLLNRLEVGNGGGDENGGSWTELNPVIGDDGKAIVDLPDLEFVHLNAIKTGWGSPEGVIDGLYLVKGKIEQPVTITANNLTMVYGDDIPTLTYSSEGGELKGTPKLSTTATKTSPVGTYPIKVEKGTVTNEKVTYVEGTLTITQAPLTVGVKDETITEGDAIPSFTLTYSGFRNSDTESNAFSKKPTAKTTATSSSKPGTYPITVSGGEAKNYALTYTKGTLTIKEKPVTITANNLTMVYGDDVPTLTYKSSGAKLNGTPKLSTTATKKSAVGTYPIKVEKGTVTNEKVTYVEGTLTITQAPLTVGVVDVTITEGDDIPTFTLTYSGFRNNDYANRAFTKMPTATTTATSNSVAGTYPITISGGVAKNYEPTYKPGTLTIEPAAGIESVYADGQGNGVIYNVNGQKLSKPRKGINIIGGKKIVVKKDQTP